MSPAGSRQMPQPKPPSKKSSALRPGDGKRLPSYINNHRNASEPLKRRDTASTSGPGTCWTPAFPAFSGQTPQPATPRGVAV
jgi:hypothetical protein